MEAPADLEIEAYVQRLVRLLDAAEEQDAAFDRVRQQLEAEHPNEWVAWRSGRLIATAPDLDGIYSAVDAAGERRGEVIVEFMDINPLILRL